MDRSNCRYRSVWLFALFYLIGKGGLSDANAVTSGIQPKDRANQTCCGAATRSLKGDEEDEH